jgi:hypothetical protein
MSQAVHFFVSAMNALQSPGGGKPAAAVARPPPCSVADQSAPFSL